MVLKEQVFLQKRFRRESLMFPATLVTDQLLLIGRFKPRPLPALRENGNRIGGKTGGGSYG